MSINNINFVWNSKLVLFGDNAIARYFISTGNGQLQHSDKKEQAEIDQWLDLSTVFCCDSDYALTILETALQMKTYLVGNEISLADIGMWSAFTLNQINPDTEAFRNVCRWFNLIGTNKVVKQCIGRLSSDLRRIQNQKANPKPVLPTLDSKDNKGGKKSNIDLGGMPPLPNAEIGKVITRFPPEASGYLHIGHVKAATLNATYAKMYKGKLLVRFDDTNPAKEKGEFEQAILEYI